tara:strand:+ start:308 stop:622 length:315 start_codon:yes stop_codon:yes gene_type:complete
MKLRAWPAKGATRRIYINHRGHWSVDVWLEPSKAEPDWQLTVKLKDAESERRSKELVADFTTSVQAFLAELVLHQWGVADIQDIHWSEWLDLARASGRRRHRAS